MLTRKIQPSVLLSALILLSLSITGCSPTTPTGPNTNAKVTPPPPTQTTPPPPAAAPSYDLTGVWGYQDPNMGRLVIYQEGSDVFGILINQGFAHHFVGKYSSPTTISGEYKYRRNRATRCATQMYVVITMTSPNTISLKWEAQDSNCDLPKGKSSTEALKRYL